MPEGPPSKAVKHPPTLDFPDLDPRREHGWNISRTVEVIAPARESLSRQSTDLHHLATRPGEKCRLAIEVERG